MGGRIVSNPPFDARILSLAGPLDVPTNLVRGQIIEDSPQVQHRVRFLYNPSLLHLSHTIDPLTSPGDQQNAGDSTALLGSTSSTMDFALLFDRTYELWDGSQAGTAAGKQGVWVDIKSLYDLCEITHPDSPSEAILYPMVQKQCYFFFGAPGRAITHYGYITSIDVTYTHWTRDMVPQRAAVNIGVQIQPPSDPANFGSSPDAVAPLTPGERKMFYLDRFDAPSTGDWAGASSGPGADW